MTYESGVTVVAVGSTTTFTAADNGITFTSPLRYGAAQMNTTDADGNFLSYTAVPYTQETPDNGAADDTQGKEEQGNTSKVVHQMTAHSREKHQKTIHQRVVRRNRVQIMHSPAHRHQLTVL